MFYFPKICFNTNHKKNPPDDSGGLMVNYLDDLKQ